jgi:hypothetical protein
MTPDQRLTVCKTLHFDLQAPEQVGQAEREAGSAPTMLVANPTSLL